MVGRLHGKPRPPPAGEAAKHLPLARLRGPATLPAPPKQGPPSPSFVSFLPSPLSFPRSFPLLYLPPPSPGPPPPSLPRDARPPNGLAEPRPFLPPLPLPQASQGRAHARGGRFLGCYARRCFLSAGLELGLGFGGGVPAGPAPPRERVSEDLDPLVSHSC